MPPPPPIPSNFDSDSGIVIISPRTSPTPPPPPLPLDNTDYESTHEGQINLLLGSLASGERSRSRRLGPTSSSATTSGETMQLLPPSITDSHGTEDHRHSLEISPEEIRAARLAQLRRTQEEEDRSLETDLQALRELRELRAQLQSRVDRSDVDEQVPEGGRATLRDTLSDTFEGLERENGIWRNELIPIPRTSSLPRGGRTFPSSNSNNFPSLTNPPIPSTNQIFSPPPPPRAQLPPPTTRTTTTLPSFESFVSRLSASFGPSSSSSSSTESNPVRRSMTPTTIDSTAVNTNPPQFSALGRVEREGTGRTTNGINLRNFFLEPTHLVGESFNDNADGDDGDSVHEEGVPLDHGEGGGNHYSSLEALNRFYAREGAAGYGDWTIVNTPFGSSRTGETVRMEIPLVNQRNRAQGEDETLPRIIEGGRRRGLEQETGMGNDGRSREETNSLSGRALRSKKGVYLIYCGGGGTAGTSSEQEEEEVVPRGFVTSTREVRGCGALICSRGLIEGVPQKVFTDDVEKRELESFSSDLPPSSLGLADLEDESEGLGERVGKRGWKGCKGCITRDLGCRRCGNHVGYRLLRPDVFCSIARDPSSSTSTHTTGPWRRINESNRIGGGGGGITGGGLVDGFLFHFRKDRTTSLRRRVGVLPNQEFDDESSSLEAEAIRGEVEEEIEKSGERLTEKLPRIGEEMLWKHIPTPQRDFQDGLISEPLDWLTPSQETWWLENSISKHSYSINGTRHGHSSQSRTKRTADEMERPPPHSTDTLSSATTTTTTVTSRPRSGSGASLNRTGAIRRSVPLATSSPNSASSSVANYDRYRSEAQQYARRVRQRLDNGEGSSTTLVAKEDAVGAGVGRVVGSLERAGYGSWYEKEGDVVIDSPDLRTKRRARQSIGR